METSVEVQLKIMINPLKKTSENFDTSTDATTEHEEIFVEVTIAESDDDSVMEATILSSWFFIEV